jgi:hypothetical protein
VPGERVVGFGADPGVDYMKQFRPELTDKNLKRPNVIL